MNRSVPRTRARLLVAATALACLGTAGLAAQSDAAPRINQISRPDSDLLVANSGQQSLLKYFADGSTVSTVSSNFGAYAMATDAAGNLYYVGNDSSGAVLLELPVAGGGEITLASVPSTNVYGVALDHAGNIYVSDINDNQILKVPAGGGNPVVYADGHPFVALGFDSHENLFAATDYTGSVVKIPAGGGADTVVATVPGEAFGLAVEPDGGFYVGSYSAGVYHYTAAGVGTQVAGMDPFTLGLALDRAGNLYATDSSQGLTELPADDSGAEVIDNDLSAPYAVVALDKPLPPPPPSATPSAPVTPSAAALTTARVPHLRGHKMTIHVTGFAPGESYRVKISGVIVGHGTADATGQINRKVRVPLRARRPKAKLVVKGTQHRVHTKIRILNGIAK